jgi:predicted 3-demethylubiquinone-9 3-methyltransferase (glyoxalase superfamily)
MVTLGTCLWFDKEAEEAVNFYAAIFRDARIGKVLRTKAAGPGEPGSVLTIAFELGGQRFTALNGGPAFKFSEAISIVVEVDTQEEVDTCWEKLQTGGGSESMCGWLKDRFGLSWQIVPRALFAYIGDSDPDKAKRATEAMLKMKKLDIETIRRAHAG